MSKLPGWTGSVFHALAGLVIGGGAAFGGPLAAAGAVMGSAALGFGREWLQHRKDDRVWSVHRVIEGGAWPVGAVLGAVLVSVLT